MILTSRGEIEGDARFGVTAQRVVGGLVRCPHGVVQDSVRDGTDVDAEGAPPDATAHHDQAGLTGRIDQMLRRWSVPGLLDDVDGGELLPPRSQGVPEGDGFLPGQLVVKIAIGGEAVRVVGRRIPAVDDPESGGAASSRFKGELDERGVRVVVGGQPQDHGPVRSRGGRDARGVHQMLVRGLFLGADQDHRPFCARNDGLAHRPHQKSAEPAHTTRAQGKQGGHPSPPRTTARRADP